MNPGALVSSVSLPTGGQVDGNLQSGEESQRDTFVLLKMLPILDMNVNLVLV